MSIDDLEVPAELVELLERVQDYLGAWENSDDNAATEVLYEALGDFLERYFQDQDVPLATAISALLHATSSVIGNAVDGNGQDGDKDRTIATMHSTAALMLTRIGQWRRETVE